MVVENQVVNAFVRNVRHAERLQSMILAWAVASAAVAKLAFVKTNTAMATFHYIYKLVIIAERARMINPAVGTMVGN